MIPERTIRITYYNINNPFYSSFYLAGFADWAKKHACDFVIAKQLPAELRRSLSSANSVNLLFAICPFKMECADKAFYFCIDALDRSQMNGGFHLPLLEMVRYYFKVNYNFGDITADERLRRHAQVIRPVLPCCPIRGSDSARIVRVLSLPGAAPLQNLGESLKRAKYLSSMLTLAQLRRTRGLQKCHDIFFVSSFYQGEQHAAVNEFRYRIMKEIKRHRDVKAVIGFSSQKRLEGKFAPLQVKWMPLRHYLTTLARSRVGIYVRGLHNCISFKFGQLFSLGLPIVGQSICNNRDQIMNHPFFDEQFALDEAEDIADRAVELLHQPDKRHTLGLSNAHLFDSSFAPAVVVGDLIKLLMME
ncbi:hypothetical protein JXA02_12155 [candidate division KSB1 bacterium]|nr:hypothetical protein [candidate division KSB1 bacterium]RQW01846.1 MAG: hypothetical protein EH222_14530 [candidate division KSB1 bacterium]